MNRTFEIYNAKTKKKIFKSKEYKNSISNIKFFMNGKYIIFTCSYLLEDKLFEIPSNEIFNENKNNSKINPEQNKEKELNDFFSEGICNTNSIPESNENILFLIKI